jgi:hypothetical protein
MDPNAMQNTSAAADRPRIISAAMAGWPIIHEEEPLKGFTTEDPSSEKKIALIKNEKV